MPDYPSQCWWTYEQVELVADRTRRWCEQVFQPSDAILFHDGKGRRKKLPGEAEVAGERVLPGGWEHEHCSLCEQTISQDEGDEHSGYTDGRDWLCRACYQDFIAPRFTSKESKR